MLHLDIDPRSVLIVTGLLSLACAGVQLSMRRGLPASIHHGTGTWAGGLVVLFVAMMLVGQRDRLPDILTSVLANGLLWGGMATCSVGLRRFAGRSAPIMAMGLGGLLFMAASAWYVLLRPDYPMRLVCNAFFILLIELVLLDAAYSIRPRNRLVKFMIACYACAAAISVIRILAVLSGIDNTGSLFEPTFFQRIFLLTFGLTWLLASAVFILIVNDRLHSMLRRAAAHDPLSGLLNRGAVTMMLEREIDRAVRHRSPLSVLMADIDYFKQINDSYGHAVGDRTIVDFATRATLQLRCYDLLSRYGGEEFLLVLPGTEASMATRVAERVRASIATEPGDGPNYTVSIGVASYVEGMTLSALVSAADQALYQAKNNGRNRVELAQLEKSTPIQAESLAIAH